MKKRKFKIRTQRLRISEKIEKCLLQYQVKGKLFTYKEFSNMVWNRMKNQMSYNDFKSHFWKLMSKPYIIQLGDKIIIEPRVADKLIDYYKIKIK